MVSAEVKPLCKKGGVADVVKDLASSLLQDKLHDNEVGVITYMNKDLAEGLRNEDYLQHIRQFDVDIDGKNERFTLGVVPLACGLDVYVLSNENYLHRDKSVYPTAGANQVEYAKRYAAFSKAAAKVIMEEPRLVRSGKTVVHLHDYHSALTAVYLKDDPGWKDRKAGIVQTVHNLGFGAWDQARGFQGVYSREIARFAGLLHHFNSKELEFYDHINFLKGGLIFSDMVNCVSQRYAIEVRQQDFGGGLEGVMGELFAQGRLRGITNGIDRDYLFFRPDLNASDCVTPYDVGQNVEKKKVLNRGIFNEILKENDMSWLADHRKQTIGMVARLTEQKFKLMCEKDSMALEKILGMDTNVVVCGDNGGGKDGIRSVMERMRKKPNFVWINPGEGLRWKDKVLGFEEIAHMVYAISDFHLVPSHYEPCGLTQMIGMRMGAIPIVSAVGGLATTVFPYDSSDERSNGFVIHPTTPEMVVATVADALSVAAPGSSTRKRLIRKCMDEDYGWDKRLGAYYDLYDAALAKGVRP
jgi:starch synthase